ncbi:MAG: DUF2442 domain-containing protein [Thermodesulfobacteriota bacterium]
MSTLKIEPREARAQRVSVSEDTLTVDLQDGRTVSVPIAWYPRLANGTTEERQNWRLIGSGDGIHWPDLDEGISIEGLFLGHPPMRVQSPFNAGSTNALRATSKAKIFIRVFRSQYFGQMIRRRR